MMGPDDIDPNKEGTKKIGIQGFQADFFTVTIIKTTNIRSIGTL